jgi:iron complex outermembrane receptor protein
MNGIQSSSYLASMFIAVGLLTGTAQPINQLEPSAENTNAITQLPEVTVTGQGKPAAGNVVDDTTLKLPLTLHETPRSVSVIEAERIREQNFRTPVDTFYYTPGVFPNSPNAGGYHFISRGFRMSPNETLIDGFQGFYVGGGQSPQMLYGVERVVLQRGPAGLLYGAATLPGGLINIITKKPSEIASTRIDLTTGTYAGNGVDFGDRATFGAELDSTGPLTKDGRVLYRGILAGDNSDHYTDDVMNKTRYLSASLTFKLDDE